MSFFSRDLIIPFTVFGLLCLIVGWGVAGAEAADNQETKLVGCEKKLEASHKGLAKHIPANACCEEDLAQCRSDLEKALAACDYQDLYETAQEALRLNNGQ